MARAHGEGPLSPNNGCLGPQSPKGLMLTPSASGRIVSKRNEASSTAFHKDGFEDQPPDFEEQVELGATLYLFAHFWARVAILRRDSLYAELGRDKQGERLKAFIQSLESRRVRVIDRAWQRIIGEALFKPSSTEHPRDCMTSYEFLNGYVGDAEFRKWLDPLVEMLGRTSHTGARQRLLLYGAVLHSMIDTLDPKHEITTERPGYGNKLTKKTRRELKYRIFRVYLDLVKEPWKYYSS